MQMRREEIDDLMVADGTFKVNSNTDSLHIKSPRVGSSEWITKEQLTDREGARVPIEDLDRKSSETQLFNFEPFVPED